MRSDLVSAIVEETVKGMGDAGLEPGEAMVAAELVLWTFQNNAMEAANAKGGEELLRQAKMVAVRTLNRLLSRVEAWPAKIQDRS